MQVEIAVDTWGPEKYAKPGEAQPDYSDPRLGGPSMNIQNTTKDVWKDVTLAVEVIDNKGGKKLLEKRFIGLWKPAERKSAPYPYGAEKTIITIGISNRRFAFALYELPEKDSERPAIPERQ